MAGLPLEQLQAQDFIPHVGSRFRVSLAEGALEFELREAKTVGTPRPGAVRSPYSLTFYAPGPRVLPQAIYGLEHSALGALEIFLVPIGREGTGFLYEANFN